VLNAFRHHGVSRGLACTRFVPSSSVLNAFRHHGVSRSRKAIVAPGCSGVLNAFRHHGVSRGKRTTARTPPQRCSTPFGITEFRGIRILAVGLVAHEVLNAFRHHGVSRSAFAHHHPRRSRVLNAFRHHGVSREGSGQLGLTGLSAQRLSASRSFAAAGEILRAWADECSTPFGITEFRGSLPRPRKRKGRLRAQRLSASRSFAACQSGHYFVRSECSTPFGITEFRGQAFACLIASCKGAQRLSASRSFAGRSSGRPRGPCRGAQRLSASRSFADHRNRGAEGFPLVLNAFRHHGVSRYKLTADPTGFEGVLNAFRHHGVSRSTPPSRTRELTKCSTPFGITEFRGLPARAGQMSVVVLNAFRHHGVSRAC